MGGSHRVRAAEGRGIARAGGNVLVDRSGVALDLLSGDPISHPSDTTILIAGSVCGGGIRVVAPWSRRVFAPSVGPFGFSGTFCRSIVGTGTGSR
jgi:hypothetical protein